LDASVLLCDFAEAVNGKLYIQGAGWNTLAADTPASLAVAVLVEVPWDQANRKHQLKLDLLNEDGVAPTGEGDEPLFHVQGELEVGRPAGVRPGSTLNIPLGIRFNVPGLSVGGYRIELSIDGTPIRSASFTVIKKP